MDFEKYAQLAATHAAEVDRGAFPTATLKALADDGMLGLVSAQGGRRQGPRPRRGGALLVERLARECGSTAMVVCMHYAATAVIEAARPDRDRARRSRPASTCRRSRSREVGSRSQFWASLEHRARPTATTCGSPARRAWSRRAHHADSYVWSSKPVAGSELTTLWLVPRDDRRAAHRRGAVRRPRPARQRLDARHRRGRARAGVRAARRRRRRLRHHDGHRAAVVQRADRDRVGGPDGGRGASARRRTSAARSSSTRARRSPICRRCARTSRACGSRPIRRRRSTPTRSPRSAASRADAMLRVLESKAAAGEAADRGHRSRDARVRRRRVPQGRRRRAASSATRAPRW